MQPNEHLLLLRQEQERRERRPAVPHLVRQPLRVRIGDQLIWMGLRLRGRPPDPVRQPVLP